MLVGYRSCDESVSMTSFSTYSIKACRAEEVDVIRKGDLAIDGNQYVQSSIASTSNPGNAKRVG